MDNAANDLEIAVYWPSGQQKHTNHELEIGHLLQFIDHQDRSVAQTTRKRKFTLFNDCHKLKALTPTKLPPVIHFSKESNNKKLVKDNNQSRQNQTISKEENCKTACSEATGVQWKTQWCVSTTTGKTPSVIANTLSQEFMTIKERLSNICEWTRGKWIICFSKSDESIHKAFWAGLCKMLSEGLLPNCKAVIREEKQKTVIWLYCDFCQAEEVHVLLRKNFKNIPNMTYNIHPYGDILSK